MRTFFYLKIEWYFFPATGYQIFIRKIDISLYILMLIDKMIFIAATKREDPWSIDN